VYGPVRTVVWADDRGDPASDPIPIATVAKGRASMLNMQLVNGTKPAIDLIGIQICRYSHIRDGTPEPFSEPFKEARNEIKGLKRKVDRKDRA